jgi:hypothetical protein
MENKGKEEENLSPHLYDPLRIKIAVRYVQQEMRKFFPELREKTLWRSMDSQIEDWHRRLGIRSFWNAVHGISIGFRLKSLVPWITSLNMKWKEGEMTVKDLWFGGQFGPIKEMKCSQSAAEVRDKIFQKENREILDKIKKILKEKKDETASRDLFPIFVVNKKEKFTVIDGNRRLLRAIIDKKENILAMVGEPIAEPPIFEHWVPTSLLVDLVFWHKRQMESGKDITETTARTIVELIKDSSAGKKEFNERVIHKDDEAHIKLINAVSRMLVI